MARARNIKPGFFKNEDLAECSIWARMCFAGLWTLADREGRLEDRHKRIKGELFAFDSIEVEPLLQELEKHGFILRYASESLGLIQIVSFCKHQNPHHKEPASAFPPPKIPGLYVVASASKPEALHPSDDAETLGEPRASPPLHDTETPGESRVSPPLHEAQAEELPDEPGVLTPTSDFPWGSNRAESGSLIPDSGFRIPPNPPPSSGAVATFPGFDRFWAAWPTSDRKQARGKCREAWVKAKAESVADAVVAHVEAKKRSDSWRKDAGQFVEAPLVYLNQRRWEGADVGKPDTGLKWFEIAGFPNENEALNERCHVGNYTRFHDGKRIPEGASH